MKKIKRKLTLNRETVRALDKKEVRSGFADGTDTVVFTRCDCSEMRTRCAQCG